MYKDPLAPSRGTYIARAVKGAMSSPGDAADKVMERCAGRWERAVRGGGGPQSRADEDWERRLHELIDAPWPCAAAEAFTSAWAAANETMAEHGLRVGRQNYGDDDDADPGLARALWCLVCCRRELGQIELFFHDSLHSTRNVRWELSTAWRALRPGGAIVVDDVDFNWGFEQFLQADDDRQPLWCMADDGQRLFAVARKVAGGK
jgi:Methyltransferase domain